MEENLHCDNCKPRGCAVGGAAGSFDAAAARRPGVYGLVVNDGVGDVARHHRQNESVHHEEDGSECHPSSCGERGGAVGVHSLDDPHPHVSGKFS